MCYRIVFLVIVAGKVFCENCTVLPSIDLTVYRTIDGEAENVTTEGSISVKEDIFHLLLVNHTIPIVCEDFVKIDNELSVLQIINCSVTKIEPGAFRIVPTLALLKISGNFLTTLQKGVFNDIKVKEIDLSRNFISQIEEEAFDNNTNLEIVRLNYNSIKEINPNWFQGSPNVYKLSIIYNELTGIPSEAFKNLAKHRPLKLRLSANRLSDLSPDSFKGCNDIDILRLNGNKMVTIPDELFTNRTIRILQVNTNSLRCFPGSLYNSTLESLEFLDNPNFNCTCLRKVKDFVEENKVKIVYPSIICEDLVKEINLVFNGNKTYEIPLLTSEG